MKSAANEKISKPLEEQLRQEKENIKKLQQVYTKQRDLAKEALKKAKKLDNLDDLHEAESQLKKSGGSSKCCKICEEYDQISRKRKSE